MSKNEFDPIQLLKVIFLFSFIICLPQILAAQFNINGDAILQADGCYRLTPAIDNQNGNILSMETIDLREPFFVDALLNFGNNNRTGADGITFIFATDNNTTGVGGGGIGYSGIAPSLVVEMDTWQNNGDGDPGLDHIGIQMNGDPNHNGGNNLEGPITVNNLEDNQDKCFRLQWDPVSFELSAFIDGQRIRYFGDIVNDIFNGNPLVHWGFTASTGGSNNRHRVCINSSTSTVVPLQDTIICLGQSVELNATPNGQTYQWDANATLSQFDIQNPVAAPTDTTEYIVQVSYECGAVFNDTIEVIPFTPAVEFEPPGAFCERDPAQALVVAPSGGIFSGTGVRNGQFNPNESGVGTFDITYEVEERGCFNDSTITIQVDSLTPLAVMPLGAFCENEADFQIIFSPSGGNWSGDVLDDGMIMLSDLGAGDFEGTYVFTNGNNCTDSISVNFRINPEPTVSIDNILPLCLNSDSISLATTPIAGGIWSGDISNEIINPTRLGIGDFQAIYEYTDNVGCISSDTLDFRVNDLPEIIFDAINPICANELLDTIRTNQIGGTFTGDVDVFGAFDPSTFVPGNYQAFYEFTDGNQCTNIDSVDFTILPVPIVAVMTVDSLCPDGTPENLTGSPLSGIWSGTANSNGTFDPVLNGAGTHTVIYEFTNTEGCNAVDSLDIIVREPDTITFNSIDPFCLENEMNQLQANPINGVWTGDVSPTGAFNPEDLNFGNFRATYTFTSTAGCVSFDSIDFEIIEPVEIAFGDSVFCQNDGFTQLSVSPSGGNFMGANISTAGTFEPSDFQIGENLILYQFNQNPGNCLVTDSVNITINPTPVLEILGDSTFCQTLETQVFSANEINGTWGGVVNGNGELEPTNLTIGNHFINYSLTSFDQCTNMVEREIEITPPPSADFLTDISICEDDGPIDLTINFSGESPFNISISDGITSETLNGLSQGDVFTVNPTMTTTYTITSVENAECGNSLSNSVTVTVNEPPFAVVIPEFQICDSDETGEATVVSFSDLITDGDNNGIWVDLDNSGGTGSFPNIDFTGVASGVYQFEYTTNSAIAPCPEAILTTEITVVECRCPSVETIAPPILCTDNAILDLTTLELTVEAGGWSILSGPPFWTAVIDGNEFNGNDSPAGDYVIQFNLSNPSNGVCPETSLQTLRLIDPPSTELPNFAAACNSNTTGEPTSINFFSLIISGDVTGTWEDIDNSGATGTFSNLEFLGVPEGIYTFRYTTGAAVTPCENQSFEIEVEVSDCRCPSVATNPVGPFCNNNAIVNLEDITISNEPGTWMRGSFPAGSTADIVGQTFDATNSVGGDYELIFTLDQTPPPGCSPSSSQIITINESPFAVVLDFGEACNSDILGNRTTFEFNSLILDGNRNGQWEDLDNSGASGSFPVLDFENIPEGRYRFRYTLSGDAPCVDEVFEVLISVVDCACPSLAIAGAGPFCNNDARLDLSTITFTNEPGTWFLTNNPGSAAIDNGIFDATGSVGGTYELTYILSGIPPLGCPQSASILIEVGEVVTAGIAPSGLEICNDGSAIDLNANLINASLGGFWRDLSPIPAIGFDESGVIDGALIESGSYVFEYVATTIAPCIRDSVQLELIIETPLDPGFSTGNLDFCSGLDTVASLFDIIDGNDLGGEWSLISGPPISNFDVSQGTIVSTDLPVGRYIFEYRVNEDGLCPLGTVRADVIVNETPEAIAGDDFELSCDIRMATLGVPDPNIPDLIYEWNGGVTDSTISNPTVINGGVYVLTVSNELTGCASTDEVIISEGMGIPQLDFSNQNISCFGENDGFINVDGISGGVPPYLFSLNGAPFTDQRSFQDLPAGNYDLIVEDAEGCQDATMFEILEPVELSIGLFSNSGILTVERGDSLTLSTNIVGTFDTIIWTPFNGLETCDFGCTSQTVMPELSTTYAVRIANEEGCTAESSLQIVVLNSRFVYIPSAFSPNNDGINDIFQIFIGKNVVSVRDFSIFDRWGESLFQRKDFIPNNTDDGWDGLFRGRFMQSGVYVYYAQIEFSDGKTEVFKGDFTLLR